MTLINLETYSNEELNILSHAITEEKFRRKKRQIETLLSEWFVITKKLHDVDPEGTPIEIDDFTILNWNDIIEYVQRDYKP